MKKYFTKENIIVILSYLFTFLLIYFLITRKTNLFASTTDFESQHYLLPEYFRNLFYQNHDLLPDFALNLGGGINIYYLSYYGLLSPIILFSYLMPHLSMLNYIIISTSFLTVLSSVLLYFYLRKNGYGFLASFLGGYLFLLSSPLIFHSHRHIMFINYFCFLIMGMFGVDNFINKKKFILLVISIFLIIMTSYYYSVGALLSLFLLLIYKYLKVNKKINLKTIIKLTIPFIIGVLLSSIILFPTIYVLLNSRAGNSINVSLIKLFIPNLSFKYILYSPYGPGCLLISLISIVYYLFKGKKEDKLLCAFILLIGLFPIFNFILNGTLYIDSKSLIPCLPLIIIITTKFLNDLFNKNINHNFVIKIIINIVILSFLELFIDYIFNSNNDGIILLMDTFGPTAALIIECFIFIIVYYFSAMKHNKKGIIVYLIIIPLIISIAVNINDPLMKKKFLHNKTNIDIKEEINNIIKNDNSFYRINNNLKGPNSFNKTINLDEYQTSIYSSTNNKYFNYLYYDTFNNNIVHRNRAMIPNSANTLYNNFMGEKYLLSKDKLNYQEIKKDKYLNIYLNTNAFPIGFATSKIININDYDKLNYPSKELNLLNGVITNDKTNTQILNVNKINTDYSILKKDNVEIIKVNNEEKIISNNGNILIRLNDIKDSGLIFINFKNNNNPSCEEKDLSITINNQKNKLTCANWKYHNKNFDFHYSLDSNILNIHLAKGTYLLSDFEIYFLFNNVYNNLNNSVDKFISTYHKGDMIKGHINVKKDGYFVIQIPYDKGFNIMVDNKIQNYKNVDNGLIGFKINKGYHDIKIEYHAPYKRIAIIVSLISLVILIVLQIKNVYNYKQ